MMTSPAPDPILAIETSSTRLYHRDGEPVWPVRGPGERDCLERMVASLGGHVEFVDEATPGTLSGEEVVVGLGLDAHADAKLYAHLTRRRCELITSLEQLAAIAPLAVVVTTYAHVNERLMDTLYDQLPLESAPGVVFSYDDEKLPLQVLARSAARACQHQNFARRRVDINPMISFGAQMSPEFSIVGGQAEPAEFRDALAAGAGLLTLYSHSDGIDAYLREDLVLCPIQSADLESQPTPAPSCVMTGLCHRCQRPMSEVLGTEVLVAPEIVKANILVYCVCWGLYPSQHIHAPAYALARQLLENFQVGALLTSWEINIQRLPLTAGLFHDIARGRTLGEALAGHLNSPAGRRNYHKLCLIGDPGVRLPAADIPDPLANIQAALKPPPPSVRCMAGLTLLRSMINRFCSGPKDAAATGALAIIDEYEGTLIDGQHHPAGLIERFRLEMLSYLTSQDTMLSKCWSRFTESIETLPVKPPCSICGRRTICRIYVLRIPGCAPRRETMCPSCGSIEDSPIDRAMSMSVEPGGLMRLRGDLPRSGWDARITVERFYTRETYQWDWPAEQAGTAAPTFQVPTQWPLVPFRLSVIIVYGDSEFSVLGCLYRGRLDVVAAGSDTP